MRVLIAILIITTVLMPRGPLLAISWYENWELDSLFNIDPNPLETQTVISAAPKSNPNKNIISTPTLPASSENAEDKVSSTPIAESAIVAPAKAQNNGFFSGLDSLFSFGSLSAPAATVEAPIAPTPLAPNYLPGLGDLFILDRLFQVNSNSTPDGAAWTTLGDIFLIDQLFGGGFFNSIGGLGMGDLFVLDRLFRPSSALLNPGATTLGDLFILDQLFNY